MTDENERMMREIAAFQREVNEIAGQAMRLEEGGPLPPTVMELQARIAELEAALRPFVMAAPVEAIPEETPLVGIVVSKDDIIKARRLLGKEEK